jgi:homoserine dehydrogenase
MPLPGGYAVTRTKVAVIGSGNIGDVTLDLLTTRWNEPMARYSESSNVI